MPAAVVLAGSRGGVDRVAQAESMVHKALVQVGNATMIEHVLAALREAGVQRVLVSTDVSEVATVVEAAGAEVIAPASSPSESVARALELVDAPLLVTTADHPLLQPDWIRSFIACAPRSADVAVMLARRHDVEQAIPGSRRTWFRFADGEWSGCNLFLLANANAGGAVAHWRTVEAERKRPWRLAARLGWSTLFDYFTGRLAMADAVTRVGLRMGVRAALVPATSGMAAVDVDTPEDLALVRTIFAKR